MRPPSAGNDDDRGWLTGARRLDSPNFDARPAGVAIDLLVIHYISLPPGRFSGDAVERFFCNRLDCDADPAFAPLRSVRVSAHFLIRRDGRCIQFVATTDRAWHAGQSRFRGRERCNDFSIGIEMEGDGAHRFTQSQYRRLARLTRLLAQRHPLAFVAGHSDIAPQRKDDPGPFFDWQRFLADIESTRLARPF